MSAALTDHPAMRRFERKAGDHPAAPGQARSRGLRAVPQCPFISAFIANNAELSDLVI